MTYLLDTDVLSELIKKRPSPPLLRRLEQLPRSTLCTSTVTVTELRFGAMLREDRDRFWRRIVEHILGRVEILPLDQQAAIIAGNIRATLRRLGKPIGLADVLIGATALASGCTLVTGNVAHFARIPHLTVENWLTDQGQNS